MKRTTTSALLGLALSVAAVGAYGCAQLQQIGAAAANLRKLQFQLGNVQGFRLNGVDISRFSQPSELSLTDVARLTQAFLSRTMPAEFTLNVLAKNPNTAGGTSAAAATPLYLSRLDWRLKIDNVETVAGVVNRQLEIPGNGQTTTIPLTVQLDLYKFFGSRGGVNDLINLATAIGGASGSSSRLEVLAKVQVTVPGIGTFAYPNEISIVDRQFSNP